MSLTYAQRLWTDVTAGRSDSAEVFCAFCRCVDETALAEQISSMSPEMVSAMVDFLSPAPVDTNALEWPDRALGLSQLEMHAFRFDFEQAAAWKKNRLKKVYLHLVQAKGEAAEPGATDNPDDAQRLREDH